MQTFLPYQSFIDSARALDRQRLGKQRVEVLQLLRALAGETRGWASHPAALMWRGYEIHLIIYGDAVCMEWQRRGYVDNCLARIRQYAGLRDLDSRNAPPPPWLTDEFCSAHRAVLLDKNPEWYSQFGWKEEPAERAANGSYPYIWPVRKV